LCGDPKTPASALTAALGTDPLTKLNQIYQPRDGPDGQMKTSIVNALKDGTRLRATVSTVRNEPAGANCDWLMKVDFSWANSFGQARNRSWQMRVRLEMVGGSPQVKQVFGATGQ
jgi:hypothetical protein